MLALLQTLAILLIALAVILLTGCRRSPAFDTIGVRVVSWPIPPDEEPPNQCLLEPLGEAPDPIEMPAESDPLVFDRAYVHLRDVRERDEWARSLAAQLEDVRVCIQILSLRRYRRGSVR